MALRRRRLLASGVAAATVLAGCGHGPSFSVRSVEVNRTRVPAGEPVAVNATVANGGHTASTFRGNLSVDGRQVSRRSVEVPSGGRGNVSFVRTFDEPGSYTLAVGDATTTVEVVAPIAVRDATLERSTVGKGDAVTVTVGLENLTSARRRWPITLSVDGDARTERPVELPAGGTGEVRFRPGFVSPGSRRITVQDVAAGSLTVTDAWRQFGYDAGRSGHATGLTGPGDGVRAAWVHQFPQASFASPVAVGGAVYVGDGNPYAEDRGGGVTALSAADGEQLWRTGLDGNVYGAVAVSEGVVVAGTTTGRQFEESATGALVGLDAHDGTRRWRIETRAPVAGSPAAAGRTVYATTGDVEEYGMVYALDPRTGESRWTVENDAPFWASPAVGDDAVYVGDAAGRVRAVSREAGAERWTYESDDRVGAAPAVTDGVVYATSHGQDPDTYRVSGKLYALDAEDGTERWHADTGQWMGSSPAVADGRVYTGVGLSTWAFDAADGGVAWRGPDPDVGSGGLSAPAVVDETVYVGIDDAAYALAADTGAVNWRYDGAGGAADSGISSPAVLDGRVYIGTGFSTMAALEAD